MVRLAIDTSSPVASVALDCGGDGIFIREVPSRDTHSQTLQATVEQLVAESPLDALSQISMVGIGLGPGSFTGIRIGLSFAKGLAWSLRVPLQGIPTFEAMAQGARDHLGPVAVISDARREEYFITCWDVKAGVLSEREPLRIVNAAELRAIVNHDSWLVIDAGNEVVPLEGVVVTPARDIAKGLLQVMHEAPAWSIQQISSIEPLYIRAVAALTIEDRRQRGMLP